MEFKLNPTQGVARKFAGVISFNTPAATGDCRIPGCEYHCFHTEENLKRSVRVVRQKLTAHMRTAHKLPAREVYFDLREDAASVGPREASASPKTESGNPTV